MKLGELGILNVGSGDTKLTFDKGKPEEVAHASRVVTEMLRAGFAIMVQVGEKDGRPLYQRAESFDPDTNEYVVMGTPDAITAANPAATLLPAARRRGRRQTAIPATKTRAVSVARSAGG